MRILITGANGFIASAWLQLPLPEEISIAGLIRPQAEIRQSYPKRDIRWLRGSLREAPWKEIEAFQPEVCLHCAWTTAPKVPYDSPEHLRYFEESRDFLQRVVGLGVRYIIGLGTCIEYQIRRQPLNELRSPIGPIGPYAESKNAMRAWLEESSARLGFQFCWTRIFYVYGPGEDPTRICTATINKLRRDEPVILKTPNSVKDYVYIKDVAAALLLLLEKRFEGMVNIGSGVGVTVYELVQTAAQLLGKTGLVKVASTEAADPLAYVVADNSRLRGLGWNLQYSLARGLETMAGT